LAIWFSTVSKANPSGFESHFVT